MLAEANLLSAIHIADNDGVTFETCTAEVFRPVSMRESRSPLDTETRKDSAVHVSLSSSLLVKQPETRGFHSPMAGRKSRTSLLNRDPLLIRRRMTTDNYRLFVHSLWREADPTRKLAWTRGPRRRRAQWSGYRPGHQSLSTPMSKNRRNAPKKFRLPRTPDLSGLRAVLEPHSCDVLHRKYASAGRIQV